jgi:predicted RNA methylase
MEPHRVFGQFSDDAERGFAFVDVCRKKFDVVLMNPPFGEASKPSKAYVEKTYPRTKNDV